MNATLLTILAVFGVWRLARIIPDTAEEGPFGIFEGVRSWALAHQGGRLGWIGRGLLCFFCLSFWLALGLAALLTASGDWPGLLVRWFGLAGAAVVLNYRVSPRMV